MCVLQGRNVDALILYFGEDPARCPFEQGSGLVVRISLFRYKSIAHNIEIVTNIRIFQ